MWDENYFFIDEKQIKAERQKAKEAKKTRWWQIKISSGICHYCQGKFPPKQLTMDHIVPIARGGKSTPGNVVAACRNCNKNKGVDTPVDLLLKSQDEES